MSTARRTGTPGGTTWAQRPLLFHNTAGTLNTVPAVTGTALAEVMTSRGLAVGDLFNSGHLDLVISNLDGAPALFRNVSEVNAKTRNHWVAFKLVGGSKSPRDAIGATLFLTAGGLRQRVDITSGGSFASSSDQRPHFGLGTATRVDKLEIRWPSGVSQTLKVPAVDRFFTITEGADVAVPALEVRP